MTIRILAIASGGGHWVQLMQLKPAFAGHDIHYATTLQGLDPGSAPVHLVPDCNREAPLRAVLCVLRLLWILASHRPQIVISTGALPGYLAIRLAKLAGARTVWIDSVANAGEMSLSGQLVRSHADLWLSQWPDVAQASGAEYAGAVL